MRGPTLARWLCASLSFVFLTIDGAAAGTEPATYRVTRWTTDDGLPQNRISCLKQTRDGYLWIGTWWGLARFDGVRFTVFDKYNTPELVSDAVNALAEDSDGTLWIGTRDGLLSYREHRFRRISNAEGLPHPDVWQLVASRDGGLWIRTDYAFARISDGKFSREWRINNPKGAGGVYSLWERSDGWLEIATHRQWLALSPKAEELKTNYVVEQTAPGWRAAWPGKQPGSLWVGREDGLQFFQNGICTAVSSNQFAPRDVRHIYEDRAGNLWVDAKSGGLSRWDHTRWTAIDLGDSIAPPVVTCMEEDREGNLWVGTDQGLFQLQTRRARTFTTRHGLPNDEVWSVCEGTDGTIWVGTQHGLGRIQDDRVVPLTVEDRAEDFITRCVWPRRDGGVWVGKFGYCVYEFTDRFMGVACPSDLPGKTTALYEDRARRLWIGTQGGAMVRSNPTEVARFTMRNGHPLEDVRVIFEDRTGTFWFGNNNKGLTRMRDGKFDVLTTNDGLSNNRIFAIHEDSDGALWFGTENGLTRYRQGRFFAFTRQNGLLEGVVNWILEDDFGYLWLSGLRGIYRIKRDQLNAVAEGRATQVECAAFGTADGMESSETNGEGQPAGWKAHDGRLWFPTTKGVVVIDPKAIQINEVSPPVAIEQIKADDEVVFGDGVNRTNPKAEIQNPKLQLLPGRARVLEIHYTANSFSNSRRVRFRYRLVGHDSRWHDAGNDRTALFTNLRPGNYQFEMMACNNHGVWSAQPATFAFSLAPHFWQTWPFYGLCAMGAMGLAASIHGYRLRWQRRLLKVEEQRALDHERTRIARDLHDDLGTALTGLALELDVIGRETGNGTPLPQRLDAAAKRTRDLAEQMREVVWTVNPRCDNASSLASFLEQQIDQFLHAAGIRVRLDFPENIPALPVDAETRHQVALGVREALTNVVRHAHATEVTVALKIEQGALVVRVSDNGRGFQAIAQSEHGLANLRTRFELMGGDFECVSEPGQGSIVSFRVPLAERTAKSMGES